MRYAIIENEKVINVTQGEKLEPSWVECDNDVGIGWAYSGGTFVAPIVPAEPKPPTPPAQTVLTKLDYMNRFEDGELAGIYTTAKSSVEIEIWLEKFKLATEIDLTDSRTIAGVQALEAAGLIGEGRAAEILA